jgi:amicoumacin kinase
MEKTVDSLMTAEMLSQFLNVYELDHDTKKLGDFENYVFEVYREGKPYILRLTHSSHRSRDEIDSELDWMRHLYDSGLSVPKVYQSKKGNYVEEIRAADHSVFIGCMYSKAKGASVGVQSDQFDNPLFRIWGETTGLMHRATKSYQPSEGIKKRDNWHEDELLDVEKHFPPGDPELIHNAKEVISSLHELPIGPDSYGLIHTDLHSGNFFYDGEKIHVFDFDDASYHWFGSDIAIPLFYSIFYKIPAGKQEERQKFADQFLAAFMEGYEKANTLPDGWKDQIKLFLMLRDVALYSVLHKKIAPEDRGERVNAMIDEIRDRIKNKRSIVTV